MPAAFRYTPLLATLLMFRYAAMPLTPLPLFCRYVAMAFRRLMPR